MKIALISVLALVFVLGCVGGQRATTISDNEGVRISSFTTTPSAIDVLSGDSIIFDVEVENVGGTTATDIDIVLFGIENQWRKGNVLAGSGDVTGRTFPSLRPPQPDRNIPGDFRAAQWEFKTPAIPEGLKTPLNIEARVTYKYNTNGFIQLTAVNDEEYRRQQITGSTIDLPVIQNSAGPLKLSVPSTAKSTFIIVDTSATTEFIYPLKIEFQNAGSGFPLGTDSTDQGKLEGEIKLLGLDVEFANCLGQTGTTVKLKDPAIQDASKIIVRLRDTQNVPIVCNLKFKNLDKWKNRPTEKISLVFNIDYKYFTKQTATVNVIGKKE